MNIVTGVFASVTDAEQAVRALLNAGYSDDDIGVVTRDSDKGAAISDDLGREYTSGATPPKDVVINRSNVYDRLPDGFVDVIRRSNLTDRAVDWYRQRLDEHLILVSVDAGERMDDASRILTDHRGTLYHRETREMPSTTATTMPGAGAGGVVEGRRTEMMQGKPEYEGHMREEEVIPLRVMHETREEIHVQRHTLDHAVSPTDYKGGMAEDGTFHMPIITEEVRIVREPIVREEIIISGVVTCGEMPTRRERVTEERTTGEEKRRPAA